jgi:hypothetical protein
MSGAGGSAGGRYKYGPYHRLRSPTQDEVTARVQLNTGQVCGRPAQWSGLFSVKAYRGQLPQGAEGIEFVTDVLPSPGAHPTLVFWYEGTQGVTVAPINGQTFATISVRVTTYRYL